MRKKLVVFTGAGMSAESGLKTFRDADGLWEGHDVMQVASIDGWRKNPALVLEFYNQRRKQLMEVEPNYAHKKLAELEKDFDIVIITQNVDDLHERAGSSKIIHLHGELKKVRSTKFPDTIKTLESWQLNLGDLCDRGYQLRPHIVWFGEEVPQMIPAMEELLNCNIFIVIGTSLQVYPAANLIRYAAAHIPKFYLDPKPGPTGFIQNLEIIEETAVKGIDLLINKLNIPQG